MNPFTLFLSAILLGTGPLSPTPDLPKMKSLFNGKNLKHWVEPENNIWWSVNNDLLEVQSGPSQAGSTLWTKKKFKDFVLQADFKMGKGTVDSGIFIRSEHDQIQIGISGSLKRDMTCSPYIPGKGYPVEASGVADLLNPQGWNTIIVRAKGNIYTTWLNGKEVMNYTSETAVLEGPLGIQLHPKRDMSIQYRNIKVGKIK